MPPLDPSLLPLSGWLFVLLGMGTKGVHPGHRIRAPKLPPDAKTHRAQGLGFDKVNQSDSVVHDIKGEKGVA